MPTNQQMKNALQKTKEKIAAGSSDAGSAFYTTDLDWAEYFLVKVDKILSGSYMPDNDDMLRLRRETSGSTKMEFPFNTETFLMVDVGGQLHERITWEAEMTSDLIGVIYMASLAGK